MDKIIKTWTEAKAIKNAIENEQNFSRKQILKAKYEDKMCNLIQELNK